MPISNYTHIGVEDAEVGIAADFIMKRILITDNLPINAQKPRIESVTSNAFPPFRNEARRKNNGIRSRPTQIFFRKLPLTPRSSLDQNVTGHQFSASSDLV